MAGIEVSGWLPSALGMQGHGLYLQARAHCIVERGQLTICLCIHLGLDMQILHSDFHGGQVQVDPAQRATSVDLIEHAVSMMSCGG